MRACPNLLIDNEYVVNNGVDEWERVSFLGPMIKQLTVAGDMCHDEKCEEAIAKCINLKSHTIEGNYTHDDGSISPRIWFSFLQYHHLRLTFLLS